MNDAAPEAYRGMDRYEARQRIIADIDAAGLLDRIEDHVHMVPYGDRGGVPIEPYLTEQWYVDAANLAKPAIEAVEQGRMKFVPKIGRRRILNGCETSSPGAFPGSYGGDIKYQRGMVQIKRYISKLTEAQSAAYDRLGAVTLRRDEDVLDTWFSSGLWAFLDLGLAGKTT